MWLRSFRSVWLMRVAWWSGAEVVEARGGVEVDPERVESRLAGGEVSCPSCPDGVLVRWGFARARRVVGSAEPVRPRCSRCRTYAVTHVLLPVTLLLRRAHVAELIWAAVVAKAAGGGHRLIGARFGDSRIDGPWVAAGDHRARAGGAALVHLGRGRRSRRVSVSDR